VTSLKHQDDHNMKKNIRIVLACLLLHGAMRLPGQNQQLLTLERCEELFLKNNLALLARQYNIGEKEALLIQAKAYPNPIFSADINLYDPQNKQWLHVDSSGQKAFSIQQLIYLGGQRKTGIDIARQNKALAESEFADLLRNLRMQLHSAFYNIYSEKTVLGNYEKQLQILDTIIAAYVVQANKNNIPLKDVTRLKSVYIKINSSKSALAMDYYEQQRNLQLLLQTTQEIQPLASEERLTGYLDLKPLNELELLAFDNRPDLKMAGESALLAALNLKYEKQQRIPAITVNASYDQRGGAFRNQLNAGISLPIPLLNTNRGNIRAAAFDKKAMDLYLQEKKLEVELDVQQAWESMQRSINDYLKVKSFFTQEFELVNKGMNDNFRLRNISILEFVDFVEAYNESLADYENVKRQLVLSAARINYITATKIY
jgi:outer membrane protein, heavy metal efflux system